IHILGHACLRTLQFLRAPSYLLDHRRMENAFGARLPRLAGPIERLIPARSRSWYYRLALERGYLDSWLVRTFVGPFGRVFRMCRELELRWIACLAGTRTGPGPQRPIPSTLEDL